MWPPARMPQSPIRYDGVLARSLPQLARLGIASPPPPYARIWVHGPSGRMPLPLSMRPPMKVEAASSRLLHGPAPGCRRHRAPDAARGSGNPARLFPDPVHLRGMDFDSVVVGAGSAGFAAARTMAAAGQRVAVVDGARQLGGLCILRGCMPTKALLHAAELRHAIEAARPWGIETGSVRIDMKALLARKDAFVADFASYRRQQLETGPFRLLRGQARFVGPNTLHVEGQGDVTALNFVLATGSVMAPPPLPSLDEVGCLTSDTALGLDVVPGSMVVLGGGPVAMEFAQYFARLGARVTVLQRGDRLLSGMDPDLGEELARALEREGLSILTGTRLLGFESHGPAKRVRFLHHGVERFLDADELFNGLGRRPATAGLGLEHVGVRVRPSGHVECDATQRTSAPHVYAAGDCCGPLEVVHVAIHQAEVAARNILAGTGMEQVDARCRLVGVFTDPGVAVAGLGERAARDAGRTVRVASHPFNDHGKSMIRGCRDGFVKLVADAATGELLGGACVGPDACELIHEVVVALAARMTASQLARVPHYHPTLSEIWTYPAEELG